MKHLVFVLFAASIGLMNLIFLQESVLANDARLLTPTPSPSPPTPTVTPSPTMVTVVPSLPLEPGVIQCLEVPMYTPIISTDGRYVMFLTSYDNVVVGDTNGYGDVVRYDRLTGQMELASIASDGTLGDDGTSYSGMSPTGRYIAFYSFATTLGGQPSRWGGLYLRDMETRETSLIVPEGGSFPTISTDGRYVAYLRADREADNRLDALLYDREAGESRIISAPADGTPANNDIYGHYPVVSQDGSVVIFMSEATNLFGDGQLAGVVAYDIASGVLSRVAQAEIVGGLAVSADGRYAAFSTQAALVPEDINTYFDVYVVDRDTGTPILASVGPNGEIGASDSGLYSGSFDWGLGLSGDGQLVAFASYAYNWGFGGSSVDQMYVHDLVAGETYPLAPPEDIAGIIAVAFASNGEALLFEAQIAPERCLGWESYTPYVTTLDLYARRLDTNANGEVDLTDILLATQAWGLTREQPGYARRLDWDQDGQIGASDLQQIAGRWRDRVAP